LKQVEAKAKIMNRTEKMSVIKEDEMPRNEDGLAEAQMMDARIESPMDSPLIPYVPIEIQMIFEVPMK
jgi:hypothetical protein